MNSIQKSLSTFKRKAKQWYYLQRYLKSSPGSVEWLIGTEIKYGGKVSGVKRNKVSPFDPRTKEQLAVGGCMGGDRMLDHGYASSYSSYLHSYIQQYGGRTTICEFGILKGTGLAIWCDLFPSGRCIGFDIDLIHIKRNMENLVNLGAFSTNSPEIYEYDQFVYSSEYLEKVLNGDKIDICVDDGHHSEITILTTLASVLPHLNNNFVYFIEDNPLVHKKIILMYEDMTVHSNDQLTVITPKMKN